MHTIICIILSWLSLNQVAGQSNFVYEEVKLKPKNLKLAYFPFSKIVIVDNRFDTVKYLIEEDGKYPATCFTISANSINSCIESLLKGTRRGDKCLLINIKQLRVTNATNVSDYNTAHSTSSSRDFVYFSAGLYEQNQSGSYSPFIYMNRKYSYTSMLGRTTAEYILTMAEDIVYSAMLIDSSIKLNKRQKKLLAAYPAIKFIKDNNPLTLDSIKINVVEDWTKYPITHCTITENGVYNDFDDFKANKFIATAVSKPILNDDSSYSFIRKDKWERFPQAFVFEKKLYIRFYEHKYLQALKCNNTFCFSIPSGIPNMYQFYSMDAIRDSWNGGDGGDIGSIANAIIGSIVAKKQIDKMNKNDFKNEFRNCFIDMDTGDIIY